VASVNDNVYVNIIANTQGFTDKMKSALQPIRQFTQVLNSIMAMGGAAMVINKVVQAVGDMEKAYAKLYPESQKAVGSLKDWNDSITRMKADSGEVVSKILNPIRAALLDIIDPAHRAKMALQEVTDVTAGWAKYTSSATKKTNEIDAAKQALKDAQDIKKSVSNQIAEYNKMVNQLGKRPDFGTRSLAYMEKGYDSSAAQAAATQDIAKYDQTLKFLSETLKQLKTDLDNANTAIKEIPIWLSENATKNLTDAEKMLLEYLKENVDLQIVRLETAQDYMDVMDKIYQQEAEALGTGTKGSSKAVSRKTRGRKDAADKADDETEAVKELSAEWQSYADLLVTISASLGEAFVTGDYITAIKQMTTALLDFIAKEAIAAGLKQILAGNIPFGIALLALGGITMGISAGARSADWGGGGGHSVELPHMASGGIVTRPTLAMIGEAGPEAVVPLGRGGGGTTIIVQGSIWQTEDLARAVAGAQARW
jgi:hypothetical protein